MDLKQYFEYAISHNASDLHLVGNEKPMIRVQGQLEAIAEQPLDSDALEAALLSLISEKQQAEFAQNHELDFGYAYDGIRFRMNLHRQHGLIGLAARAIPAEIPGPEALRFEPILKQFTGLLDGLVLIVGPTGDGKSTTIASMIEEVNKSRKAHIVTVEDPIEFTFTDKESLIEQREVGVDTPSFQSALKHVLRQDPDVIFVGEMRDPETIATVLTAAETGHLVFSTLHTSTAAEAVERIVDVFDGSKQKQILIQLAAVLRGVVAQQLIPTTDGKRVAAREILVNTSGVSNLIRENNIAQIRSAIQTGAADGMITMEQSVQQLLKEGLIDEKTAAQRVGTQRRVS